MIPIHFLEFVSLESVPVQVVLCNLSAHSPSQKLKTFGKFVFSSRKLLKPCWNKWCWHDVKQLWHLVWPRVALCDVVQTRGIRSLGVELRSFYAVASHSLRTLRDCTIVCITFIISFCHFLTYSIRIWIMASSGQRNSVTP